MNESMKQAMRRIAETKKTTHPWERQEPYPQPYYSYSAKDQQWQSLRSQALAKSDVYVGDKFTILSWNIDFMLPLADARMTAALKHLQLLQAGIKSPCVIFLQEMLVSDLKLIQEQSWVRDSFNITDITSEYWESGYYGTCTLISKLLPISSVFRVHYSATAMERDGLFVDIALEGQKPLRLCNTHLESLVADPPIRPQQLRTAAIYMHLPQVSASVLGGDLNAIQAFDQTLHTDNKLQDGHLTVCDTDSSEGGETWGQMAQTTLRKQFGLSRMDKLLFCGSVSIDNFETFGFGVEVEQENDRLRLMQEDLEAGWITDHLGVRGDFRLKLGVSSDAQDSIRSKISRSKIV